MSNEVGSKITRMIDMTLAAMEKMEPDKMMIEEGSLPTLPASGAKTRDDDLGMPTSRPPRASLSVLCANIR